MKKFISKPILIFIIAFSVLLGPAYNLFLSFDVKISSDCDTYLAIANGDFYKQNLTRKYRVIVPVCAKIISYPIAVVYYKLWPLRANDNGPLRLGFFIVNMILMSLVGVVIYYLGKEYELKDSTSIIIMIIVLVGGRWGNFLSAIPLTDSFYMLIISLVYYAIKSNRHLLLIPCLILGPISKEAYLLIIPYIIHFSAYSKYKLLLFSLLGLVITWQLRSYIDSISFETDLTSSLKDDISTINNIKISIFKMFSIRGLGEMFTVVGVFTLIPIFTMIHERTRKILFQRTDKLLWLIFPISIAHGLLSTDVARMMYLFVAPIAILIGISIENNIYKEKIKSFFSFSESN